MKQGEIWYADLNPSQGSEQAGLRPVVVVSGNMLNEHLNSIIVMPITTKIKHYKGNLILKPNNKNGLASNSEVLVFHIRSVSQKRLVRKVGTIENSQLNGLIKTLNDILKY